MKKIWFALMLTGVLAAGAGHAAEDKVLTPQQQKMKDCNAEAKTKALKGQERKDFMKTCLSGKAQDAGAGASDKAPAAAKKTSAQKDKMKACNAEAKDKALQGQERKDFMKTCLSG